MQVDKDLFLFIYLILMAAAVSSEASQLTVLSRLARQALQDRIGVYIWLMIAWFQLQRFTVHASVDTHIMLVR